MPDTFFTKAASLQRDNEPYATAYIVRRKNPSSGKPGDKAIITKDGQIHGWIGGGCTRGIVLKEAILAMNDRKPRLVHISPDSLARDGGNTKLYKMTCQSGGEVEVYIEPVLPQPQLLIFGSSHIAMALARIAKAMEYRVQAVMSSADDSLFPDVDQVIELRDFSAAMTSKSPYVIVCTQGEGDADALAAALSLDCPYLSFVASRMKANGIYRELHDRGIGFDRLGKIKTPAGLDIGAKTPQEVAISILAEIIQDFRQPANTGDGDLPGQATETVELNNEDYYLNPVCNIPIQKSTARHVLEYEGEQVYFCCDGCKVSFEREPEKYMVKA